MLNEIYLKKGNVLKSKFNKKGKYIIPIIIEEPLGGTQYIFTVPENIMDLNKNIVYKADFKLIKRCNIDVWEYLLNNLNNLE